MCKIPLRAWIAAMVFLTTYINYSVTVNMAISIVSMVRTKTHQVPECFAHTQKEASPINDSHIFPDYGPRYDWNQHEQGIILGGYFWGYTIFSFFAGSIAEKLGPAKLIFIVSVISCIANFSCVIAVKLHYGALVFCRIILGACGGLTYPSLHVMIARWAPPAEKGKFLSCLMGNTFSTCVTWPTLAYIITNFGWVWSFHAISIQQVVYSIIFFFIASDSPQDNKFITPEELAYIEEAQGDSVDKDQGSPPFKKIFISCPFWVLTALHFGSVWGLFIQIQSVPKFLAEVIGFRIQDTGVLAAIPHFARFLLGIGFGHLGDYLKYKNHMTPLVIRKSFILASHILPGSLMVIICFVGCNWQPIIALLTFSMGLNGAAVITNLQNPHDLAPNYAGTMSGIITSIGGTTGIMVPTVVAFFIHDHNGLREWNNIFVLGGTMYIVSGILFIIFGSVDEQSWNRIQIEE